MSRPWISSQERRGIIVLLAIIALCATVAGVRRCTTEHHARQLYLEQQAYLDSVAVRVDSVSSRIDSVSTNPVSDDTVRTRKPRSRKSSTPSLPLPTRNPIDEPVN